jgi:hypothetical protein
VPDPVLLTDMTNRSGLLALVLAVS